MFPAAAGDMERPCVFVCPKPKPTLFADSAADEGEAEAEAEAAVSPERLRGDEAVTGENVKDTATTEHDHAFSQHSRMKHCLTCSVPLLWLRLSLCTCAVS